MEQCFNLYVNSEKYNLLVSNDYNWDNIPRDKIDKGAEKAIIDIFPIQCCNYKEITQENFPWCFILTKEQYHIHHYGFIIISNIEKKRLDACYTSYVKRMLEIAAAKVIGYYPQSKKQKIVKESL
jgi:hypothetical protein